MTSGVSKPTAADVCSAVIRLRQRKLPDPAVAGNAGSFFKNPVISQEQLESLRGLYPTLPAWTVNQEFAKIPAAWMIEHCGLKSSDCGRGPTPGDPNPHLSAPKLCGGVVTSWGATIVHWDEQSHFMIGHDGSFSTASLGSISSLVGFGTCEVIGE